MKITTLGTSHGDPTPGHFCTSVLLEQGGRYYLVDAGEGANPRLVQHGLCAAMLSAVWITHVHVDHVGSVPILCEQAEKYRKNYPDLCLSIYFPEEQMIAGLNAWRRSMHSGRFVMRAGNADIATKLFAFKEGPFYDDGTVAVTAIPTKHMEYLKEFGGQSYALKVASQGKNVLFTGDLKRSFEDFPLEAAQNCDAVFCELTHYPLENAISALEQLRTGRLVFYHLGNPWQPEEGMKKALDMCAHLPYPVEFSYDDYELEL